MSKKILLAIFISLSLLISGISFATNKSHHRSTRVNAESTASASVDRRAHHKVKAKKLQSDQVVNINSADAATLATLKGIGLKKAETIVQYRSQNGEFNSVEDLTKVKGISDKTIAKNQQRLKV